MEGSVEGCHPVRGMNMNHEIINYDRYRMKPGELILNLLLAMGFCFLVGMIFYDNWIISSILSLLGIAWIPGRKKSWPGAEESL